MTMTPRSEILLDQPGLRTLAFHLQPGDEVPAHASTAHLMVFVRSGRGAVLHGDRWVEVAAGDWLHVAPGEPHGFRAAAEPLELLVVLASTGPSVSASMTVDEAQHRFEGATAALNGLGIDTCCGGGESLEVAARRAGRSLEEVLEALQGANR